MDIKTLALKLALEFVQTLANPLTAKHVVCTDLNEGDIVKEAIMPARVCHFPMPDGGTVIITFRVSYK